MSQITKMTVFSLSLVAALVLGIGIGEHNTKNEDSNYGVRLSERCVPEDGVLLKFDYTGRGTAYITVLPPEPEAPAPAKKEKKQ